MICLLELISCFMFEMNVVFDENLVFLGVNFFWLFFKLRLCVKNYFFFEVVCFVDMMIIVYY